MEDYTDKVMQHFMQPHNVGYIENPDGKGKAGNPRCGDVMELYLKIENGVIVNVKFRTMGCGAAIATSSVLTDLVKGKTIDEALKVTNNKIVDELGGLPPNKIHCSVLADAALKKAIEDYKSKN